MLNTSKNLYYKIWQKDDKSIINLSYCYFLSVNSILTLKIDKTCACSLNVVSQLDIVTYRNAFFTNMDDDV